LLLRHAVNVSLPRVRLLFVAALALAGTGPVQARPLAPLYDPVSLNIGLACQWKYSCVEAQTRAMKRARSYVARRKPALRQIHQCNRNAARSGGRVDWIGFDNCIRNPRLRAKR
jgi:hypothetical protein